MKRIRIVLVLLLCGLMTPFTMQAMAELGDIAARGAEDGAEGALGRIAEDMVKAGQKALDSVLDRGEEAVGAVDALMGKEANALKAVEGGLKTNKLTVEQAQKAFEAIGKSAREEADEIIRMAADTAETSEILLERIDDASVKITEASAKALEGEGISRAVIDELNAAARETDRTIAAGGRPKGKPNAAAQPDAAGVRSAEQVAKVKENVSELGARTDSLAGRLEGGADGTTGRADSVADGSMSGADDASRGAEYGQPKEPGELGAWEKMRGRSADRDRLTGEIDSVSEHLSAVEKDMKNSRLVVKDPVKDPVTGDETPGSVEIPPSGIKVGSKSREQVKALEDFLGKDKSKEIDPNDITITEDTEKGLLVETPVLRIKVKLKDKDGKLTDQELEFTIENPSSLEKNLLKDNGKSGKFTLGKDGRLSFKSEDKDAVEGVSAGSKEGLEKIEALKEEITRLKARRSERENFLNTGWRIFKGSGKTVWKAGKYVVDHPGESLAVTGKAAWKATKFAGKTLKTVGTKVTNGILEVVKMMMTGVFFGVPSMIYQTLMQQAAAKALYQQITSVYNISPGFSVQIPASLISPSNAAQAGTYLYVAVDPSTSGYGNSMSSAFLENASYYVVYQTGAQWGSTYATSTNAFGVWVSLNTGLIFMDGGVPYSEQTPFSYLMEPSNDATIQAVKGAQTTLSVQDYTQAAFDAVGNRANYIYSEGFMDAIAPWHIATESYDHAVTPNATIQAMFSAVESSVTHGKEKVQKPSRYAPKVLVPTLNIFRNGIQKVPGFLPGSKVVPPTISIRQFEGTGILNRLLGSQSSADNIAQSIQLITTLSSTMSPASSTPLNSKSSTPTNVVQAVLDAQAGLKQALSDATSQSYGNEVEAASAALKNARTNLQEAISVNGAGTNLGLDSSLAVNAYNIYLYETEDTPIVKFMQQNRFSDLIPAKDYVVFLDSNLNIAPLFSTAVITRPNGVGVIDFDTSQINSNIQYMVSLVTGLIYLYSANGPGTVMSTLNNMPAAQYVSGTVIPALFQQINLVLSSADSQNLTNQIISMASYATNLYYQGPVVKNGCLLEKIPLELSAQDAVAIKQNLLDDACNGLVVPAQATTHKTSFGSSATMSIPQSQLDSMCLYKVSKIVPGSKTKIGVFGTTADGQQVYDYVVPVATILNADGTYGFQMMPLGISEAAGNASSMSGVQMIVSLVTGQVYDNNYCLKAGTALVIERNADFSPMPAQPGQYSVPFNQTNADGTVTSVPVAAVQNLPLSTAFMPTFCNPFNIAYGSLHSNPQYVQDVAAVSAAQLAVNSAQLAVNSAQVAEQEAFNVVSDDSKKAENPTYVNFMWTNVQKNPTSELINEIFSSKKFAQYVPFLYLKGESKSDKPLLFKRDMQNWVSAKIALTSAQAALTSAQAALIPLQNALRLKVQALQSVLQPPYNPVKKAQDQMVIMCPMYWMHYLKFAWAAQSANAQAITYTNTSQQPVNMSINWINSTVSTSATPLGYSLGQSLPITNILEVVSAYEGWQEIMNSTSGIAKVMQSGPFQFSKNEKYNVYLTLPPSNGPLNLATGNFFYNMVPVASPTSVFVLGNLDSGIAQSIAVSLNQTVSIQNATSGLTAPLTIDQCNTGDLLGHSYLDMLKENPVAIDISTGDVWVPTSLGDSALCYNKDQGNIANAQCNVLKIGTVDAEKVLNVALKNQGTTKAQIQIDNPGLYSTLMNAQALAIQKAQLALTTYFAGSLLSLCQEQITNGTYIYAVNVSPENYYEATDYWIATDNYGSPQGILTPQTQYMVSVVTANVYQMNSSDAQQTAQSIMQSITTGTGIATIDTPLTGFQKMFGIGAYASKATMLTPVATNNPKLFNIIESLNNLQNQNFLQSQFASSANTAVLGGQIHLAALQTASPVSALYNTLYLVNGKYYLAMPGTAGAPTYYYDFNAELQDVNSSSGTAVYTPIPGDAGRGMYYMVEGTGSAAVVTPVSELTGYGCQAMRMRFGIAVDKSGNETMGLPVYNPPLPMTADDVTLKPGASGTNMKCLTSAANIAANTAVTDTYTYYQYKNISSESYLTRCFLNTKIPVYNQATQAVSSLPEYQDYYVDLVTGECYSPDGTPRLSNITVAYNFTGDASTGIVANSALDFSNPLFVWGELDLLGESLQAYMMYQDTNADLASGYNQYQVQQYSTSFTLYNGGIPTVYAYAVDASGNIQITQNGKTMSPKQTSMSSALVSALNGGSLLATKSYTMNINGVVPSGTPNAGATVTVTETFVAPKQYMVSYTDAAGDLITDMFQTPVTSGAGTAPGASTNTYNNPPLDAPLQAQLLQGKPFCARVFASCPYGQETVQNINTTIATATTAVKELALGTTGVTCGLLYQPTTATTFALPSAGLLSAIFSGANPSGSTGAMNGQYFAFYDCYNNGVAGDSDTVSSSGVVPSKGQYGTYISVVANMSNDYSAYPGLYAGNFNVEFASSAGSTATTYGAPYLRVMPLAGALNNSNGTSYTVPPASGTEYLYKYQYDIVPNAMLAKLKSTLNISGNVAGFMQLVSALDAGNLAGVTASNASVNQAAAAAISNQVFYGTPLNALTQEPKGRYVYKLACASGGADADPTAATNGLCQMFYTAGATNPDTYIDMYNGIVFQSKTTATNQQLLYPIGFSVSHDYCNAIGQMIGGVMPAQDSTELVINTPVIVTNSKGNPVGQGAALPGQIVNGKVSVATKA